MVLNVDTFRVDSTNINQKWWRTQSVLWLWQWRVMEVHCDQEPFYHHITVKHKKYSKSFPDCWICTKTPRCFQTTYTLYSPGYKKNTIPVAVAALCSDGQKPNCFYKDFPSCKVHLHILLVRIFLEIAWLSCSCPSEWKAVHAPVLKSNHLLTQLTKSQSPYLSNLAAVPINHTKLLCNTFDSL